MNGISSEVRWHVKKAARRACMAGSTLLAPLNGGVRVLTYHRFASARHDPFAVEPAVFARQMHWIAERGIAVSLDDLVECVAGRRTLAKGSILVTIDDGYESVHSVALPILERDRVPAVAFLPAGLMDVGTVAGDPEPRLDWGQVRDLVSAGVEIGSHGWSHRTFGRMDLGEMRDEANRSRAVLAEKCGHEVRSFAYPYGRWPDYDASSAQALRAAGYECAFTSQHGPLRAGMDLYELPRVKIEGGEAMWAFVSACRGGLDAWSMVDRGMWPLQMQRG